MVVGTEPDFTEGGAPARLRRGGGGVLVACVRNNRKRKEDSRITLAS